MDTGNQIAVGMSGVSLATVVAVLIKIGRWQERFDQMWEAHQDEVKHLREVQNVMAELQIRRATMEAQQKGVMHKNSPLRVAPEAKRALAPYAEEFRRFYIEKGWPVGDIHKFVMPSVEQFLAMEREFGSQIAGALCIPFGLNEGACLVAAIEYARTLAAGGDPFPEDKKVA